MALTIELTNLEFSLSKPFTHYYYYYSANSTSKQYLFLFAHICGEELGQLLLSLPLLLERSLFLLRHLQQSLGIIKYE